MPGDIQIIYRHGFTTPSGFSVNFTVGRIVSRKGKPGGGSSENPSSDAATGQHFTTAKGMNDAD